MSTTITTANNPKMAKPAGHYSHACLANGFIFISGQLPVDSDGHKLAELPFEQQARQVLENVKLALEGAGVSIKNLVQVRVYITEIKNWPIFDGIYKEWIGEFKPARAVAGVNELHYGSQVEVEVIATSI